jgi:outer membrane protein assembly factor BamD (BamD/ComL family)
LVLLAVCVSCAPQVPANYAAHEAAAEAAVARRDHAAAAREWGEAAAIAENETDRQEALYRQATSSLRAGSAAEHQRILKSLATTPGPRQQRAVFDLATAEFARDPVVGSGELRAAILRYPASGLARGALERLLGALKSSERAMALGQLLEQVNEPRLRERLLFLQARSYEVTGNPAKALDIYEQQVRDFPYPRGQYWDESLLRQSVLQLDRGDVSRAVALLEHMLSFREHATIVGSYDRRYADATLLLAYIFVDSSWQQAHTLLGDFPSRHPDSRNRDDALWAATLLAHSHGEQEAACRSAVELTSEFPDSRYAPCAHRYCAEAKTKGACKGYILEERNTARATLEATLQRILATPK